ncbi:MAG: hypothetical protein KC619_11610 [Myxococcales bacterium]|nr:hypothetical protein [Myxococcales bacterium]
MNGNLVIALVCAMAAFECHPTSTSLPDAGTDAGAPPPAGFDINGTVRNRLTGTLPPEGTCVHVSEVPPADEEGPLDFLATSTVGSDGSYLLTNVSTTSAAGLWLIVDPCPEPGPTTVMATANGLSADAYAGLGEGDILAADPIFFLAGEDATSIDQSLVAVGATATLGTDGAIVGFVLDATGVPIGGATVGCGGCATTYYADDNPSDGLFGSPSTGINAATDPALLAMFAIPGAPLHTYSADDGGAHSFGSVDSRAYPGYVVLVRLDAE